jgi:hypothetical protein
LRWKRKLRRSAYVARDFRENEILNLIRVSFTLIQSTERKYFTYKRR